MEVDERETCPTDVLCNEIDVEVLGVFIALAAKAYSVLTV